MKTYFSEWIPKIQRYSEKLDNLTLLTNQHWVVIDDIDNNKCIYIFRTNNSLLISQNGKVEKASWEYLGNNSLLIDKKDESFLFKHGFFDENVLALKIDNSEEYVLLVNENRYEGELNSSVKINNFLQSKYASLVSKTASIRASKEVLVESSRRLIRLNGVEIEIDGNSKMYYIEPGLKVFVNGQIAPNGKYKIGFMEYIHVVDGVIQEETMF